MPDPDPSDPPQQASVGTAGPHLTESFELLSNETRLSILLALWEAYDPGWDENAVAFSELYDAVTMDDSGNFTYHLDKLTGHYVSKTEDGYTLTAPGQRIVRAVIAGSGFDDARIPPTRRDFPCPRCDGSGLEIHYRDGAVYLTCHTCAGAIDAADVPRGTVAIWEFDPAGLADRAPEELHFAAGTSSRYRFRMMREGVCPECSGVTEESLLLCEEHEPGSDGSCPNCGSSDSIRVRYTCSVCKYLDVAPVELLVTDHPAIVAFYDERGIDGRLRGADPDDHAEVVRLFQAMSHTLVSTDPVRIRVSVPCQGDELRLTLNDALEVTDVSGPAP